MSAEKQNQLFRVIERMTENELTYLKKFGYKVNKDNSEIIGLLDLAVKHSQKEKKSEKELIMLFNKKYPLSNYVKTKSRLLKFVIDGLSNYDRKDFELSEVFELIAISDSLSKRDLFHDAMHFLVKAEKIALSIEDYSLLILIKRRVLRIQSYINVFDRQTIENQLENCREELLDKQKNNFQAFQGALFVLAFQKTIGYPSNKAHFELLNKIEQHSFLQISLQELGSASALDKVIAKSGIHFMRNRPDLVVEDAKSFFTQFNPSERLYKSLTMKILAFYDSLLQACLFTGKKDLFEMYFKELELIETESSKDLNLKRAIIFYLTCMTLMTNKKIEELNKLVTTFDSIILLESIPNYRKVTIAYYLILGAFFTGNYKSVLKMIQYLNSRNDWNIREDIKIALEIIKLIIYFEQRKFELLEYELRNYKLRIKQLGVNLLPTRLVSDYIQYAMKDKKFVELKEKLVELLTIYDKAKKKSQSEKMFASVFDIGIWFESLLQRQPIAQIFTKS